jgi:hypothetical protein
VEAIEEAPRELDSEIPDDCENLGTILYGLKNDLIAAAVVRTAKVNDEAEDADPGNAKRRQGRRQGDSASSHVHLVKKRFYTHRASMIKCICNLKFKN